MRPWLPILLLGVVGLAVGGALVILRLHHTIGLGGIGVGGVLIIIGLGGGLLRGRGVRAEDKKTMTQTRQQGGGRKAIVAILVIIVIGVGTFYGTSYLSSVQPGGSSSASLSITSTPSSSSLSITSTPSSGSGTLSSTSQSSVQTTSLASCSTAFQIALDGSAIEYTGSGSSASVFLTTNKSPDVIVLYVTVVDSPMGSDSAPPVVSNITDGSALLSFHKRASIVTSSANAGLDKFSVEEWYAIASGTLSNDSIIVKTARSTPLITIIAFGISGANTASPFDSTSLVPSSGTGASNGTISVTISTKSPDEMIIGGAGMSSVSPAAGSGYALIGSDGGQSLAQDPIAEYGVTCAAGSNYSVSFNGEHSGLEGTQTWVMIADAVAEAGQP
jgi:hypothetical protein